MVTVALGLFPKIFEINYLIYILEHWTGWSREILLGLYKILVD